MPTNHARLLRQNAEITSYEKQLQKFADAFCDEVFANIITMYVGNLPMIVHEAFSSREQLQAILVHRERTRCLLYEFSLLKQRCLLDHKAYSKPQFPFLEHIHGNWIETNTMTYLEYLSFHHLNRSEFRREINDWMSEYSYKRRMKDTRLLRKNISKRFAAQLELRTRRQRIENPQKCHKDQTKTRRKWLAKDAQRVITYLQLSATNKVLLEQSEVQFRNSEIHKLFKILSLQCKILGDRVQTTIPLKKLENLALNLIVLSQCTTKLQYSAVALSCISQMTEQTLTGFLLTKFETLVESLWGEIDNHLEEQGQVRDVITNWERMSDSKVLEKLREFMSFCMTFGTLEHFGFSQNVADVVYGEFKAQKKHKSLTSFALAFCDVAEFVFSRLCTCVETKSLGPLLHNGDEYAMWYDDCAKIMEWNLMLGQDCMIRTFSDQEFQLLCEKCIAKGEEYVKFAKNLKDRREINALVSKVRIVYGDFMTAEIVGRPREAPFTLLLTGDSSIGKTSIQNFLVSVFAKFTGLPDDPRYFYTRDASDDFMSGFKSYMWFINMDDVATTAPALLSGVDKSVSELFRYVQNIPTTANMADLNEKGKVAIRPAFIIASSNAPDLNADKMFTCPSAARRRLPWRVTPTVKPEYRMSPDINMLDPSKCNQAASQFPDYWTYTVEEIRPLPLRDPITKAKNLGAQEIMILNNVDQKEFLLWFVEAVKTHRARQKSMQERLKASAKIEMCVHHIPAYMCCGTLETQGAITPIMTSTVTTITLWGLLFLFIRRIVLNNFWFRNALSIANYRPPSPKTLVHRAKMSCLAITDKIMPATEHFSVTRDSMRAIGERAAEQLMTRKTTIVFGGILAGIAVWKLLRPSEVKQEISEKPQEEQVRFVKPIPFNEKQKVRWVTEIPIFDRCNLLPRSISSKARPKDEILEMISKNVANVVFSSEDKTYACDILCLGGFDMAMNKHIFDALPEVCQAKFLFYDKFTHIGNNTSTVFEKKTLKVAEYHDVVIIRLETFKPLPDITGFFPKQPMKGRFNGTYLYRNKEGLLIKSEVKNIEVRYRENPNMNGDLITYHVAEGWVEDDTKNGMCGSPLVVDTSAGFVIAGIHSLGGRHNKACASIITQELLSQTPTIDVGECDMGELQPQMELNQEKFLQPPVELTPRLRQHDPLAYRLSGLGEVYGSLSTGPSTMKTKVASTYVADFWKEKGKSTNCVPPVFGARCWHKALDDMMSPDILVSSAEANFIAKILARDFINHMTHDQKLLIEFYDYETAILGADGINGVDKIDMKTSTGFPMKKSKKSIFKQLPNGKYSVPEEVIEACERIHTNAKKGKRSQVIFSASLKDEPRDREKVADYSIRVFMSAPMPYCIVMRQYFLSLCRVIQSSPLQFETAVGINAHSSQWDVLANTLLEFSSKFIVGDHSKYDKRMAAVYIYNMFKVAIYIITHCLVYSNKITLDEVPQVEHTMQMLAIETAYAFVDFNGTLVSFLKNHASGHILTVIINSFANSGYIRMAYRRHVTDDPLLEKFQERCRVVTYGDDFIVAVKPEFQSFNFHVMKREMSTFGVTITPAVKTAEDYDFLPIEEIDFLKRKFVYNTDLQRWVGPLDMASIEKSLLIALRSDSITPEEQSVMAMMSAQQEMFFHGRDKFEEFTAQVHQCLDWYNLTYIAKHSMFPSYETFLDRYLNSEIVHVDEFVESMTDTAHFFKETPQTFSQLDEQCECQNTMRLNKLRILFNPEFSDTLQVSFAGKSEYHVKSFCRLCQCSSQQSKTIGSSSSDYHSFDDQKIHGAEQKITLTREEQQTRNSSAIELVRCQPCDNRCVRHRSTDILEEQMEMENIQFVDEASANSVDLSQNPDPTRTSDDLDTAGFQSYLKRPVKILTTTWNEGDYLLQDFEPWKLWANQVQIKQKLNNFGLFRGTLHLKLMVNASPFFYGAGRMCYEPLIGYMRDRTTGSYTSGNIAGYAIARSQQKGIEFYPQTSQGGEMRLPFFYPKTWLDITSAQDLENMGTCHLFSYTPLSNANNVSTASVTLTVIAWCEDAELSAPTYALAVQSEYAKLGPVSGPSSAVAEAARSLARIPVIKPYALGTEMVANGIGSVAKYFGFTNVPNTEAQKPFKPGSHYGMATTEISTPYEKLSLDDKNELTIDPRIAGLPAKDELVISEIIGRESYLTTATWSATDPSSTKLFNTYVSPSLYDYESFTSPTYIRHFQTPMAHLARMFQSWRGSIIFRFRFVCTHFHKGRVRITWDPRYDLSTLGTSLVSDTITTSFTKIVDIGETQDVEFEIPYMQALAFMTNYSTAASSPQRLYSSSSLPTIASWNSFFNGTLSVTVLNPQTSPVTSSDIQMLIFVKAGSDFVFANPQEAPPSFTFLEPQAEVLEKDSSDEEKQYMTFTERTRVDDLMKIHMGESIKSMRQLLHRQNFYTCFVGKAGADAQSSGAYNRWNFPRYPQISGQNSPGRNQFAYAQGVISTAQTYPYAFTAPSVFAMLAPLYIGARGSIVYNANVDAPEPSNLVSLARSNQIDWTSKATTTQQGWYNPASWDAYNPSALGSVSKYRTQTYVNGASGRVLTNQNTQAGIMAHFPYYSPLRFTSSVGYQNSNGDASALPIPVEEQNQGVELLISTKNNQAARVGNETATIVDLYFMAGHDFTFLYFNCVPTFYYYGTPYGTAT